MVHVLTAAWLEASESPVIKVPASSFADSDWYIVFFHVSDQVLVAMSRSLIAYEYYSTDCRDGN